MEIILETKSREFVILSKDKDLNFQPCRRYKIKWIKLKKELAVPKMFGWKLRNNSEINLKISIKLTKTLWREIRIMVPSNQPCTCIKCSWPRKKLFTEHWIWWDYPTKHSSVISGLQLSREILLPKFNKTLHMVAKSQLLKKLQSSHQLCSEPMSSLPFGNWSLIPTVSQLTKKPIQLLFHMSPSLSSSEWCSVIWAMALFFAWAQFTWSWKETTKVLAWWDIYSCW